MEIKVLGGGNAFSDNNSSFLIDVQNVKILFDCSENSFRYIRDNNIDIDIVYISHTHFDHIGGLEKLIFYNYFVKNKKTQIIAHKDLELEKFLPEGKLFENGEIINTSYYSLKEINENKFIEYYIYDFEDVIFEYKLVKGNHIVTPNYGLIINENNKILLITGDTKGSKTIRNEILILSNLKENSKMLIFHDYQETGSPINSIHCCEEDFKHYYSDLENLKNIKFYKYHNDTFDKQFTGEIFKI